MFTIYIHSTDEKLIDKILSTFTFLDPNPTGQIQNQAPSVTGSIVMFSRDETTMTVQLDASSSVSNIKDIQVWTDSLPEKKWIPFQSLVKLPFSEIAYVRFRDDLGNISPIYKDYSSPPQGPPNAP